MVSILDILKYFGYENPEEAYKQLPMDVIQYYIRLYYNMITNN